MTLRTTTTNSMSAISQLLLTRFWPNLSQLSGTTFNRDVNCHGNICPCNICPGDICPYQEYLSCYSPDFDKTLKVGSWDHLEQIPTVMMIFVQATFVLATFVHISNISAVTDPILARFWQNFKSRFLGLSLVDFNCHDDICHFEIL